MTALDNLRSLMAEFPPSDLTKQIFAQLDLLETTVTGLSGVTTGVLGVAAGYKLARGLATTATASDTIVTGLTTVVAAVACLEDAPSLTTNQVQAVVGDQAGAPAAGSILLKSWKPTATGDVTPLAATAFGKKVSWIAVGT